MVLTMYPSDQPTYSPELVFDALSGNRRNGSAEASCALEVLLANREKLPQALFVKLNSSLCIPGIAEWAAAY